MLTWFLPMKKIMVLLQVKLAWLSSTYGIPWAAPQLSNSWLSLPLSLWLALNLHVGVLRYCIYVIIHSILNWHDIFINPWTLRLHCHPHVVPAWLQMFLIFLADFNMTGYICLVRVSCLNGNSTCFHSLAGCMGLICVVQLNSELGHWTIQSVRDLFINTSIFFTGFVIFFLKPVGGLHIIILRRLVLFSKWSYK